MKLPFNIDLKDKVCVVTGGTGVICGAMADALAECGAKVAILALGPVSYTHLDVYKRQVEFRLK